MNLIKKELIEKAFEKYNDSLSYYELIALEEVEATKGDFRAGVEFAESQLEELAVEFAIWLTFEPQVNNYDKNKKDVEELFQEFIKEKNG